MEPITAAVAAFTAVKSGIKAGRELQDMVGELGKLWGGLDSARANHNQKRTKAMRNEFISVEEEALESFAALKKAQQMENELRNFVNLSYGPNAWAEVVRIQAQIRLKKKAALKEAQRKKERMIEYVAIGVLIVILISFFSVVFYILLPDIKSLVK